MVLNQHDFWPYEKRRLDTGIYRRKDYMHEDTGRRWWPYTKRWSVSRGESTQKKPTLSTQRSHTLSLQNCEKILLLKPPSLWRLVTAALEKWILGAISEQSTAQETIYNWIVTIFASKMSWLPSYLSLILPLRGNWLWQGEMDFLGKHTASVGSWGAERPGNSCWAPLLPSCRVWCRLLKIFIHKCTYL